MKLLVVDDVLTEDEIHATRLFLEKIRAKGGSSFIEKGTPVEFPVEKLFDIARLIFDLSPMVGWETWNALRTDNDPEPNWHKDKDEMWKRETGESRYPLCSISYYPYVKDLQGGKFVTEDHAVIPKTNRLIVFTPTIWHGVELHTGIRETIGINPWPYRMEPIRP